MDENNKISEFLQKEYDYLAQLLIDNEQLGERRVQFFLTLIGGIAAVIGLFGISEVTKDFNPIEDRYKIEWLIAIFLVVIMILLPFGIMTLNS